MKCSRLFFLLIVLALALFIVGCSTKPVDQIQSAEKAMAQAKAEHAEEFAPEDWKAGEDAWRTANARVDAGKYGEATTLLLKAQTRFQKARDIAKGKREDTIKEIKNNKTTAELRCKALKADLEKAGKKLPAAKRQEFEDACKAAEEKIAKVQVQLDGGQYSDAKMTVGTTLREIWEAQKELEKATGKKTS